MESIVTGISVTDLNKRRLWLGPPGETKNYTDDPDQAVKEDVTKRQKRVRRGHEMLYSLRIFVYPETDTEFFDVPWEQPQRVVHRDDPRHPLQGFVQPLDEGSWRRHAQVREDLERMGGPPPPRGDAASSSAGPPDEPIVERDARRERSRSPRRAKEIAATSKGPPPSQNALPTAMRRNKRRRSPSTSTESAPLPPAFPPPRRIRIFGPRQDDLPKKAMPARPPPPLDDRRRAWSPSP